MEEQSRKVVGYLSVLGDGTRIYDEKPQHDAPETFPLCVVPGPPMYRFHMRYIDRPKDPYYHTRWDKAVPAQVLGGDLEQAEAKLYSMLGAPRDIYREWVYTVDRVEETQ